MTAHPQTKALAEEFADIRTQNNPGKLFQAGLALLTNERPRDAVNAFELALEACPDEPLYMSYLGLALAISRKNGPQAIELCEKAARRQFFQAEVFHNLGRVYLLSGQRKKAREAFIRGIELDEGKTDNFAALESMGVRRPPVFTFLDRGHLLNRLAGKALARIGAR